MPSFLVSSEWFDGELVRVADRPLLKHFRAQRLRAGEELTIVDEGHSRYRALIETLDGSGALLRVLERLPEAQKDCHITLCQSLLKRERMDLVVEKATELGVDAIVPFTSGRSERFGDLEGKRERWQRVAEAALQQSARPRPLDLRPLTDFDGILQSADAGSIMLWEEERGLAFREALSGAGREVSLVVGPEGGFTGAEARAFREAGGAVCSFGDSILRAETAAIAAVSAALFGLGAL